MEASLIEDEYVAKPLLTGSQQKKSGHMCDHQPCKQRAVKMAVFDGSAFDGEFLILSFTYYLFCIAGESTANYLLHVIVSYASR